MLIAFASSELQRDLQAGERARVKQWRIRLRDLVRRFDIAFSHAKRDADRRLAAFALRSEAKVVG
jgi:hypothetical protein